MTTLGEGTGPGGPSKPLKLEDRDQKRQVLFHAREIEGGVVT